MKLDPAQIRARIEQHQKELARAEGEESALQGESEQAMQELRKVVGASPGQEAEGVRKLREEVEAGEAEIQRLLDQADSLREGV